VKPSDIQGGIDVRSIYFYVFCSFPDLQISDKEIDPRIRTVARQHLTGIDFSSIQTNNNRLAKQALQQIYQALYSRREGLVSVFQRTLGCTWMSSVQAMSIFPSHSERVSSLLEQMPEARIGDVLGRIASAQVIRGALTGLMMQVAQEQDRLARKDDEQVRHVLMSSHRSVAGLAMLDQTARMPVHGDIVKYELRTFPDGSVSLQESHILPFPTDE